MSVRKAEGAWKRACTRFQEVTAAAPVACQVEPFLYVDPVPVPVSVPVPGAGRDEGRHHQFLQSVDPLLEDLEAAYRQGSPGRSSVLRALDRIATGWPKGAPLSSRLIHALAKTVIIGSPLDKAGRPTRVRGWVLRAWSLVDAYLRRFHIAAARPVLARAGVDLRCIHARVRDAAWFDEDYELSLRVNRPLLNPGAFDAVDDVTVDAWRNHCAILAALGRWHAVHAHVEAVKPLLQRAWRTDVLDDLATWADAASEHVVRSSAAEPAEADAEWRRSLEARVQGLEAQTTEKRWLSTREAADLLGYALGSFRRVYGQDGQLKACASQVGGQLLWDRKRLEEHLDARRL